MPSARTQPHRGFGEARTSAFAPGPRRSRGGAERWSAFGHQLLAHDPDWARQYSRLAAVLRRRLGLAWQVEHVGSTSVPGLVARPIIDLAIRTPEGLSTPDAEAALMGCGWSRPTGCSDHNVARMLESGDEIAVARVYEPSQWAEAGARVVVDWLRCHPADRDEFARLKRKSLDNGRPGAGYEQAKAAFAEVVVAKAQRARRRDG